MRKFTVSVDMFSSYELTKADAIVLHALLSDTLVAGNPKHKKIAVEWFEARFSAEYRTARTAVDMLEKQINEREFGICDQEVEVRRKDEVSYALKESDEMTLQYMLGHKLNNMSRENLPINVLYAIKWFASNFQVSLNDATNAVNKYQADMHVN